jgi:hypothetical protein
MFTAENFKKTFKRNPPYEKNYEFEKLNGNFRIIYQGCELL